MDRLNKQNNLTRTTRAVDGIAVFLGFVFSISASAAEPVSLIERYTCRKDPDPAVLAKITSERDTRIYSQVGDIVTIERKVPLDRGFTVMEDHDDLLIFRGAILGAGEVFLKNQVGPHTVHQPIWDSPIYLAFQPTDFYEPRSLGYTDDHTAEVHFTDPGLRAEADEILQNQPTELIITVGGRTPYLPCSQMDPHQSATRGDASTYSIRLQGKPKTEIRLDDFALAPHLISKEISQRGWDDGYYRAAAAAAARDGLAYLKTRFEGFGTPLSERVTPATTRDGSKRTQERHVDPTTPFFD